MKTILNLALALAIAALAVPAMSAENKDSLAIQNKISTQNAGEEQQLQIQHQQKTQKGTPAESGQGDMNKVQTKEQTKTKAQYKDADGNGVGDENKIQKKEQKKKRIRTKAKKQAGETKGNMVPQDGGSGNRQGQGTGTGNGPK